jgi:hypothetical protein
MISLCKKWKLTLRLNVWHNRSMLDLSLSQYEGTFSSRNSWWTCAGPRIRCHRILDGDLLPWRISLEGSERRAALRRPADVIENAILQALNQTQFVLVQKLPKSLCVSRTTVWRRLTDSLWLFVKHLHWHRCPPDSCAVTNSNRLVKRIAQTLRVCTGQWLTKFYDLGRVLVLFVDKPRKNLSSSGSVTRWKDETHDLTVDTLRAVFANWVERPKQVALNENHYYW